MSVEVESDGPQVRHRLSLVGATVSADEFRFSFPTM